MKAASTAGVLEDGANRDTLLKLLRVKTTASLLALTSINDYLTRMQPGQSKIYYICSNSLEEAIRSPYLESLSERKLEVVLFTDSVDEYMMQVGLETSAFFPPTKCHSSELLLTNFRIHIYRMYEKHCNHGSNVPCVAPKR
jgi:HSP90 family molecular chaperone